MQELQGWLSTMQHTEQAGSGARGETEIGASHTSPDMCVATALELGPEEPGIGEPQPWQEGKASIKQCCTQRARASILIVRSGHTISSQMHCWSGGMPPLLRCRAESAGSSSSSTVSTYCTWAALPDLSSSMQPQPVLPPQSGAGSKGCEASFSRPW